MKYVMRLKICERMLMADQLVLGVLELVATFFIMAEM